MVNCSSFNATGRFYNNNNTITIDCGGLYFSNTEIYDVTLSDGTVIGTVGPDIQISNQGDSLTNLVDSITTWINNTIQNTDSTTSYTQTHTLCYCNNKIVITVEYEKLSFTF